MRGSGYALLREVAVPSEHGGNGGTELLRQLGHEHRADHHVSWDVAALCHCNTVTFLRVSFHAREDSIDTDPQRPRTWNLKSFGQRSDSPCNHGNCAGVLILAG